MQLVTSETEKIRFVQFVASNWDTIVTKLIISWNTIVTKLITSDLENDVMHSLCY